MQLIRKFNKGFRFLWSLSIFLVNMFRLKDKTGGIITNAFQKILNNSMRKPNKIWIDTESKFYNSSFKKSLKDNDVNMYLIQNEGNLLLVKILSEL